MDGHVGFYFYSDLTFHTQLLNKQYLFSNEPKCDEDEDEDEEAARVRQKLLGGLSEWDVVATRADLDSEIAKVVAAMQETSDIKVSSTCNACDSPIMDGHICVS